MDRAEPGENETDTRLYSPIFTPLDQMGDFGIGIGLYFSALRFFSILMLIVGIISLPSVHYYAAYDYSKYQSNIQSYILKGSAICTDTSWVSCPTCSSANFENDRTKNNSTGVYYLKNNCECPPFFQGMINWSVVIIICLGFLVNKRLQQQMSKAFDEDEQTAQDYSIQVDNPPFEAKDHDEWKEYFERISGGERVLVCTIGLDNDKLVRALVERRDRLQQLSQKLGVKCLPKNIDMVRMSRISAEIEERRSIYKAFAVLVFYSFGIYIDVPAIVQRIVVLNAKIRGMSQKKYNVTNVFITFDTEIGQRTVLEKLSLGKLYIYENDTSKVKKEYLFQGRVLEVFEPEEPCTIRWQELNTNKFDRYLFSFLTFFVIFGSISLLFWLINLLSKASAHFIVIAISTTNIVFPMVCSKLTEFESHKSATEVELSLFTKIAFFRCVNTAIVIHIITPFTSITNNNIDGKDALLPSVTAILVADFITTNFLPLLDPVGNFKRHILAPRLRGQAEMNACFKGNMWSVAERYTNSAKILFLCFYYCSVFPCLFFICSAILFINYFVDSFCLMRSWSRAPRLGPYIARINRDYIPLILLSVLIIISSYWWFGFPFDNLCEDNFNKGVYKYCNQNLFSRKDFLSFSKFDEGWMTEDQKQISDFFAYTCLAILIFGLLEILYIICFSLEGLFYSTYSSNYDPDTNDMGIRFSSVESRSSYIPQVNSPMHPHPLIVCGYEQMDYELFDWQDPDNSYEYYNVTEDLSAVFDRPSLLSSHDQFSYVKYWNPEHSKDDSTLKTTTIGGAKIRVLADYLPALKHIRVNRYNTTASPLEGTDVTQQYGDNISEVESLLKVNKMN